jgi:hypothetical protein
MYLDVCRLEVETVIDDDRYVQFGEAAHLLLLIRQDVVFGRWRPTPTLTLPANDNLTLRRQCIDRIEVHAMDKIHARRIWPSKGEGQTDNICLMQLVFLSKQHEAAQSNAEVQNLAAQSFQIQDVSGFALCNALLLPRSINALRTM